MTMSMNQIKNVMRGIVKDYEYVSIECWDKPYPYGGVFRVMVFGNEYDSYPILKYLTDMCNHERYNINLKDYGDEPILSYTRLGFSKNGIWI